MILEHNVSVYEILDSSVIYLLTKAIEGFCKELLKFRIILKK